MKKILKIHFNLAIIILFCTFCFLLSPKPFSKHHANAFDISPTEIEMKEYQSLEHSVPTVSETEYEITETQKNDHSPRSNYTIVIDAGHGGPDPGSIGYKTKVYESEINLKISKMLQSKLEEAGINTVLTRSTSEALAEGRGRAFKKRDMEMRREIIKESRPNMVISVHQNSFTNHSLHGAQVFYDKTSNISKEIAEFIQTEFQKNLDHANKSISPGDYYMLKCTTAPSVIVECGFLSNETEEKLLQTNEYQQKIVDSIYLGIINFLQIK